MKHQGTGFVLALKPRPRWYQAFAQLTMKRMSCDLELAADPRAGALLETLLTTERCTFQGCPAQGHGPTLTVAALRPHLHPLRADIERRPSCTAE